MARRATRNNDNIFMGPDFSFVQRGRHISFEVHRTNHEFEALQRQLVGSKVELQQEIKNAAQELSSLISKYSSFDLVAHLWYSHGLYDAETYCESDLKLRPHYVEYATLTELKNTECRITPEFVVQRPDLERAEELIESIYRNAVWLRIAKTVEPGRIEPPTALETATFFGAIRKMMVGPPAYAQHWAEVLNGLFDNDLVRDAIASVVGVPYPTVFALAQAIGRLMAKRVAERLQEVRKQGNELQRQLAAYMSSGVYESDQKKKAVFDQLRNLEQKDRKRTIDGLLAQWAFVALADQFSFTLDELVTGTAITGTEALKFVELFQTELGSVSPGFIVPTSSNLLRRKPIVNLGQKYFCPMPDRILWAIKPAIEDLLRKNARWESYQQARAALLISQAVRLFQKLMPGSTADTSVFYPIGGTGLEAELDALIVFDRYIILIEGKAGARDRSSDKDEAVQARLNEIVGDASRQALRAAQYVRDSPVPQFRREDLTLLTLERTPKTEVIPVSISLESLDAFTSELSEVQAITGLHEPVLALCLTDLRVISEIITRPTEFTHFLRWRMSFAGRNDVVGDRDEINWLAVYLMEGPKPPRAPDNQDFQIFQSYTDAFDAYFLYVHGDRNTPASRPQQEIPSFLIRLIEGIQKTRKFGFTQAAEFLLDCTFPERQRIANAAQNLGRASARERERMGVRIELPERTIVLIPGSNDGHGQSESTNPTLSLFIEPENDWAIQDWTLTT